MATQSFSSPAGRNPSSASGVKGNVSVPSSKPSIGRNIEQPLVGKQTVNGNKSMPGSKGKGQAIGTVPSQHITGKVGRGSSAMPGGVIPGKI